MLILSHLFRGDHHALRGEMVIDVIDLSGTQYQISGGFNCGTVIIQYTGFPRGGTIRIQRATDIHIACTVNQAVRPVIQGLYP
ncbi:hypothetical protein BvCmsKSP061_02698 [Escherichia coli]|nr:hypothetical protein BvCmsKSP061_02698 [Escherichia coli]GDQ98430.1 hypothetical protein BvCmsNSP045_05239 [Escherichia coli]